MFENKRYAGIIYDDIANGEGVGAVFFTQGCPHHCKGCHNPETWSNDGGLPLTKEIIDELFDYFESTPFSNRLTLSGGDPLANLEISNYLTVEFKKCYPDKQLWIFTGYTFDFIKDKEEYQSILKLADVLIDGEFEIDKRDITLEFRGSSNQCMYKRLNNMWKKIN